MSPGSLNLDLSAKEPSENQNSPAETGRHSDQCGGPARARGSSSEPFMSARADEREKKRGVCRGDGGGFLKLFMALYS